MTARRRGRTRSRSAELAVLALLGAVAGCSGPSVPSDGSSPIGGGSRAAAAGTPTAAPPAAPRPTPRSEPVRSDLAECVPGTWRLKSTEPTAGGSVESLVFSGRGAFDLVFSEAGRWRLVGDPDVPLTATFAVAGLKVDATAAVDGTARGRYRLVDSAGVFRLERTAGEVRLQWPTGERTVGMEALAGALVPDGTAALRCSGGSLTMQAENVTLGLTRIRR